MTSLFARCLMPLLLLFYVMTMSACTSQVRHENALFSAAVSGDTVRVKRLLQSGIDPDMLRENGVTALYLAAQHQRTIIIQQLLDAGAHVDASGYRGATPLIVAATAGHSDVVSLLLAKGAKPDWRRNDGATALYMASQEGNLEIVRQLLAAKADVNLPAYQNATALFIAAQSGHSNIVKVLLEKGAAVEKGLPDGTTPLHAVVKQGNADMVRLLVQSGADPHAKTRQGESAIELARGKDNQTIMKLLGQPGTGHVMNSAEAAALVDKPSIPGQNGATTGSGVAGNISGPGSAFKDDAEITRQPVPQASQKHESQVVAPSKPKIIKTEQAVSGQLVNSTDPLPGASAPKLQVKKQALRKRPAQKTSISKPVVNNANEIKSANSLAVPDPETDEIDAADFNNDPASFGWSAGNFQKSVDAAVAPVTGSSNSTSVSRQQDIKSTLAKAVGSSKRLTTDSAYLASLDTEADAVSFEKSASNLVSQNADTLLASGIAHHFRGEFKQAASEFLSLYKTYPGSEKAADALLQLSKTLAAMDRKGASCSTLARLRKEYPQAWPRLVADANNLSKNTGCP